MNVDNPFHYVEIKGDPTKQEVLERERFYGYSPSKPLILDDSIYRDLYNSIIDDKDILRSDRFLGWNANKKQLKSSISIWKDLNLKLHEIDMLLPSHKKVEEGELIMTPEFVGAMKTVHPFELPISFNVRKMGKIYAQLQIICLEAVSDNPEENEILYTGIDLSRLSDEMTACLYNHEIAHTQLGSRKNCTNLLDLETIPILVEEIFASKIDPSGRTLEKLRNIRLLELAKMLYTYSVTPNMAYISRIEADTYIKSLLQAISLMNIYLTGSQNIQKEMQRDIDRVFAEQFSVQDMLNHFHTNLDETPKILSKLKVPK